MTTATIELPAAPTILSPAPAASPTAAIEVRDLVKQFDGFTAVDHLSFSVPPGEIFGFLGPNGAGKSTTIKMLCTLLQPTSGTAIVNGYDVVRAPDAVRASIGIIFQDYSLDDRITAEENLRFHCMIYHVPRSRAKGAHRARPGARRSRPIAPASKVRTFSGGMKRRLEIARGLLHRPAVLFLDEPTVGLDPQTRETLWQQIHDLRRREGDDGLHDHPLHGRSRALRPHRRHRPRPADCPRHPGGAESDARRRRRPPRHHRQS